MQVVFPSNLTAYFLHPIMNVIVVFFIIILKFK